MEYAYMLDGGAPLTMKFQVNETFANAGVPAITGTDTDAGVILPATTSGVNQLGVTLDTATFVSAQQTDGTSTEREVAITISPHAAFRALMSGGSTEGTALELFPVTTASSTGADVVTGDSFANFDQGVIWGYDGANAGQKRKITIGDATDATCGVPFDNDTVVGDNFLRAPWWFLDLSANDITTTTNLWQVDATATVDAGWLANVIDMELRDVAGDGRNKSFLLFSFNDHLLSVTTGT